MSGDNNAAEENPMTRTQIARLALALVVSADYAIDDAVIETAIDRGHDLDDDGEIDEISAIVRALLRDL